jgi:hypothetical protein
VYELGAIAEYIHHTVISSLEVKQLDDQSGKLCTLFYFLWRNNCKHQNLLIGTKNFGIISRSEKARDPDIREKLKRDYIFWGGSRRKVQYQFKSHQENDIEGRLLISIP